MTDKDGYVMHREILERRGVEHLEDMGGYDARTERLLRAEV